MATAKRRRSMYSALFHAGTQKFSMFQYFLYLACLSAALSSHAARPGPTKLFGLVMTQGSKITVWSCWQAHKLKDFSKSHWVPNIVYTIFTLLSREATVLSHFAAEATTFPYRVYTMTPIEKVSLLVVCIIISRLQMCDSLPINCVHLCLSLIVVCNCFHLCCHWLSFECWLLVCSYSLFVHMCACHMSY